MNDKIKIALFITLAIANFMYAQENQNKPDPSPLKKPALIQLTADQNQVLPELRNQAYVGTQQFAPQQDSEWVEQCLNLSLDQKKWGCKIVAYRIRWFNGNWSSWFVPGVNDLYKKSFEPLRRFWACFNDHAFEIIYLADQKIDFSKITKQTR
jgi:hypothetical protein